MKTEMVIKTKEELQEHLGHDIVLAMYGDDLTLECVHCGEVLAYDENQLN